MEKEYQTASQHNKAILTTLFKDQQHSVTSLQKKTKISPRILRKYLNSLKEKDIITEEVDELRWKHFNLEEMTAKANNWKDRRRKRMDNRPRIIRLSKKGKKIFLQLVFSDINQSLRDIASLLSELCSDGKRLIEWETAEEETALRETVGLAQRKGSEAFQKAVKDYMHRSALRSMPIDEACKNLHFIRCVRFRNSADSNEFVTIIRGNEVFPPISAKNLEDINFNARFFGLK
jgi:DNA-binding MarR family transcriptional regulator